MTSPLTFEVTAAEAGRTLADIVRRLQPGTSWNKARELCKRGKVRRNGVVESDAAQRVGEHDRVELVPHAPRRHEHVLDESALVHVDADVVVVNKPAGLLSVPFEDTDKNTLVDRLRFLLRRKTGFQGAELGVVQRLDKDTTGLLVFARNLASKRTLQQQFRVHSIERRYLAIVHGSLARPLDCDTVLLRDRGDGLRGSFGRFRRASGEPPRDAQRAITHLRPLRALRGATLIECTLQTGRQHQIRIHAAESGQPLVGERVYVRDYTGPVIEAPRPMLHATLLGFAHPRTGKALRFELPAPSDFMDTLAQLALESSE
jgi:23S rRNA pseudouridine1911/1915/1917 synthase